LILVAGCQDPTGVSSTDVPVHRARWTAQGLTSYEYDYKVTGFLINYAGRSIHLVVRAGVVQSATDVATGKAELGAPTQWPTIEALFDKAVQAAAAGSLGGVRFDPTLDYPTEIDLNGPPDASGSVFASGLRPLS
jgi:hypothetical protein